MIKLVQELYARYASGVPDKYRPDGIVQDEWYQVVAFKTEQKSIYVLNNVTNVSAKKQIEELSVGVVNKNKKLVFFIAQNAELVCQESAAMKHKKLIGINQEEINKIKVVQEGTDKELIKLKNLVDQLKKK